MLKQLLDVPDGVQALEAAGTVTSDDYAQVFSPLVDQIRRARQRLRLLYQFGPSFARITPSALWADTRLGMSYLPLLDGCALTTDIPWIREPARSIGPWMPCPMRVYADEERDDALAWLAALPTGTGPSNFQIAKAYIGGTSGAVTSIGKLLIAGRFRAGRARD